MELTGHGNLRRRAQALGLATISAMAALAAWPKLSVLLPPCPIHEYFGLLCPGCGGTRALVALLHGHLGDAFRFNALVVALFPFALWFALDCYRRALSQHRFEWPQVPAVVYGLLGAGTVFGVLRN